jgi:hypothetical protein
MAKNDEKIEEAEVTTKPKGKEKPTAVEEADDTEGLIKMHKDGVNLHVHPTTVDAHKTAGWKHA